MSDTDPRWNVIRPALSSLLGLETCEDADLVRGLLEELLEQRAAAVADGRATQERIEALKAQALEIQFQSAYYHGRWESAIDETARLQRDLTRLRGDVDDMLNAVGIHIQDLRTLWDTAIDDITSLRAEVERLRGAL